MPTDDDLDDDRPSRRRRDRDDDDRDDDRPSRRRRDEPEDDYDDRPRRAPDSDGLGVAAMIIGIIAAVCSLGCLVPYVGCLAGPLSVIGGITAVILGFVGRSKNPKSGKSMAGIITGFAALAIDILMVVIAFAVLGGIAAMQPK